MGLIITNLGKEKALNYILGKTTSTENLILKLFSNDTTPEEEDILTDFTEVSGGGYASKTLTATNWTISDGSASYPQQTWTFTGSAGSVYGYYLVNATSNQVIFAERFSGAPYTITTSGDVIRVTLNVSIL